LELMRALNEAWSTLKDGARRAAFDATSGAPEGSTRSGQAADDPNVPFWTGAAGSPPGRPWGPVVNFGIFAGWSVGEIARQDRGYLVWLRDRPEAQAMRVEIDQLTNPDGEEAPAGTRGGARP
jgi:hypothetical protein